MSTEEYQRALEAAFKEYEKLAQERTLIEARLSQLAQSIGTLMRLCGATTPVPWGLTDACRVVLRNAGVPMSPTEVRDRLAASGFDLSRYSNELAAIHTILRRLNDSGELQFVASPGKHLYRWKAPPKAIAIGPEVAEYIRRSGHTHIPGSKPPKKKK